MKLWVSMLSSTIFTNFSRKLLDLRILQEISYEKISEQAQAHSAHSDLGKAAAKNGLGHVQAGGSFKHNVFQLKDAWMVAGT